MCVGLKRNELKGGITARGSGDEKWFTGALYILAVEDIFWKCSPFRKPTSQLTAGPHRWEGRTRRGRGQGNGMTP